MPEDGVPLQHTSKILATEELLQLASHFRNLGVTKFRLTGGEPTLNKDLLPIVQGLKLLDPKQIGMTSNATMLGGSTKSNQKLDDLVDAGLDSLNISLDTLDGAKFEQLTRRPASNLNRVLTALERGSTLYNNTQLNLKVNCVVMRGINDDEIASFIKSSQTRFGPNLQIRFIEYMPFTENGWETNKYVPYKELLDREDVRELGLQPIDEKDVDPHDTTKWYTYGNNKSRIGFITSMSSHFCAGCNRLRLTGDGQIKVCLFDGSVGNELSLRDALRADLSPTELNKLVYHAIQRKHAKLGGHASPEELMKDSANNRPMTLIGG
jgi:molybdenum cofactor biosynthesis enzyme MoaA